MPPTAIDPTIISRAQTLRHSTTNGEKRLWSELKKFRKHYQLHVRKQAPIGPYIADFAIHSKKIIIEVDGEHHLSSKGLVRDKKRDAWFKGQGYRVLRFNTGELIENLGGCVEKILDEVGAV
ncbi:MAG TPA: endonuclease domain-containing protein [Rhizobiales bacterium]|nr:endonuclease domain-containing protein [Hyphomicrobiales bacterium]